MQVFTRIIPIIYLVNTVLAFGKLRELKDARAADGEKLHEKTNKDGEIHELVLLVRKSSKGFDKIAKTFAKASEEFYGQVSFVYINLEDPHYKQIMISLGVNENSSPTYVYINVSEPHQNEYGTHVPVVYRPDDKHDLSKNAVVNFVKKTLKGEVEGSAMPQKVEKISNPIVF